MKNNSKRTLYEKQDDNIATANKWVGTWAASPYLITPDNMPPSPGLSNNTLRQYIRVSIGGNKVRLKFSNECGKSVITMNSVHLAEAASQGNGSIKPGTDKVIKFNGKESVIIPAGETVTSDTFDYDLKKLAIMAITIYFGSMPTELTGHPGSRTISYIQEGNAVDALSLPSAVPTERWYTILGMDVFTDASYRAIAALGDSTTDGRGVTTNANQRWTDVLATCLQENPAASKVSVLNEGIGGNGIFGGLGPAAIKRFDRDVMGQSGVRYLIVFEGINDIGGTRDFITESIEKIISAYREFICKAHEKNILAYGATITPCQGNAYYSEEHEQMRQELNKWIRTSGEYDAVLDFDAAVKDPDNEARLLSIYDSGDHLHLSPEGYKRIGETIDINLFI